MRTHRGGEAGGTRDEKDAAREEEKNEEVEQDRCRLCLEGECDGPLVQPCSVVQSLGGS